MSVHFVLSQRCVCVLARKRNHEAEKGWSGGGRNPPEASPRLQSDLATYTHNAHPVSSAKQIHRNIHTRKPCHQSVSQRKPCRLQTRLRNTAGERTQHLNVPELQILASPDACLVCTPSTFYPTSHHHHLAKSDPFRKLD